MTVIDRISFRFDMADEQFARTLYADWDRFCQKCAIDVIDGFFTRCDSLDTFMAIDRLELDLGYIQREDFYEQFPRRLREALERTFLPCLGASGQDTFSSEIEGIRRTQTVVREKRFENLLHYLEYGFCLPEWNNVGFDAEEELRHLNDRKALERLLLLITRNPNVSERFFALAHYRLLAGMMSVLLLSPVPGHAAKQRYLAMSLEHMPRVVLRFIHDTKDTGCMENMALLLENPLIRRIMAAETENHAEIDLPEYWFGLYVWLLEYYPFNGVPMFGDRQHFRLHLNRSLLSFIRRRSYTSYLSKAELTEQFLREIFGTGHCFVVTDIIYRYRRLNPDGMPAIGNRCVWDIPTGLGKETLQWSRQAVHEHPLDELVLLFLSPAVSDTQKSQLLRHYARWQPDLLWQLVRYSSVDYGAGKTVGRIPFRMWNAWAGCATWLEMISGVSLSLGETLRQADVFLSTRYHMHEDTLAETLVRFIAGWQEERISCESVSDVLRRYVSVLESILSATGCSDIMYGELSVMHDKSGTAPIENSFRHEYVSEVISKEIETALCIEKVGNAPDEALQPCYIDVPNAGLCLLALWLPRLFDMLGLLSRNAGAKKNFKDTGAMIRAVFILQRLVADTKKEYKEHELAFNRILAGCPFCVPLPETLELTADEIWAVESMLAGVKAHWSKLKTTSMKGFQSSFIERPGRLEQREDKWVLYVEERAYDILLDAIPWSFRQIRLPWLKKNISVVWRDKEEYDIEKL